MRSRLRGAALIVTIAVVIAGCDDPEPTPPPLGGSSGTSATPTPSASTGPSAGSTPSPTDSSQPSPSATVVTDADQVAGQKAIQLFLTRVNQAADAKNDAAVKGTWQQSCIWCATVIQPVQMAAFDTSWRLTPARVRNPRITYWKPGISGQLLYRVTMSVSAMKLVDDKGRTQRAAAAVSGGSYSFAAEKVSGTWQVVQGIQGDITIPAP